MTLSKNKVGLAIGIFAAVLHAIWAIVIAAGVGETFLSWIMPLHFIDVALSTFTFSLGSAALLVIAAFICGYVIGWLYALIWNSLKKVK